MAISKKNGQYKPKRKTEVPGQALGYSLQFTLLTHLLLQAPEGSLCSLEVLDDVAQENNSGDIRFIQSKSALTANPAADRDKIIIGKHFLIGLTLLHSPGFEVGKSLFLSYMYRVQLKGV